MSEPFRVLYSFPHALDRAGIATTALNQVRGLARAGVRVELFCTWVGSAVLPPEVQVHQTLRIAGRRIPHRAMGVQRAYSFHDAVVAAWLRRHPAAVDLVHAWPRGCLRTLRVARDLGVPGLREAPSPHTASAYRAVARAAADAGVELPATHSHAPDPRVLAREEEEYDTAAAVLVHSAYVEGEFLAEGFPSSRLLRHRYGVDLSTVGRRSVPRGDGPFTAVFLGRGDAPKGLHVALRAWDLAALPGARLVVAGALEREYAASLEPALSSPSVTVRGFVTDVSTLLTGADVLLLPSFTEGSALVTLEAQAAGCVPLVSDSSGAIGDPGTDHLVHPTGDHQLLAAQLQDLAGHPDRLAQLSARATELRPELSWDAAAQVLVGCYERAVARGPRV